MYQRWSAILALPETSLWVCPSWPNAKNGTLLKQAEAVKTGDSISRSRAVSPIELKVRQFLKDGTGARTPVAAALLRLQKWTDLVLGDGLDAAMGAASGDGNHGSASEVIQLIAED